MNILIADDHDLIRESLVKYVKSAFPEASVWEAHDYGSLMDLLQEKQAAMVICDYVMPGMNGLQGVDSLLKRLGDVPLVMISGLAPLDVAVSALRMGASGFLFKTMTPAAMMRAFQLIACGEVFVPHAVLSFVQTDVSASHVDDQKIVAAPETEHLVFERLTERESEILHLLTEGLTNKEIANRLTLQEITVKVHLKHVFRKLDVSNRTQASNLALKLGFSGKKRVSVS